MIEHIVLIGGIPAGPELLIILLVLVLLFGANKIPELAKASGQAMGEFQKGRQQVEEELEEMSESSQNGEQEDEEDEKEEDEREINSETEKSEK